MRVGLNASTFLLVIVSIAVNLPGARPRSVAAREVSVGRERQVIPGYNEPNTPPNVPISDQLRNALTDPALVRDGQVNLNQAVYVRLFDRQRTTTPKAIVILIPGIISGANTFKVLGSVLVQRSGGDVEVWAVDRRANLLEDAVPMIQAENARTTKAALAAMDSYLNDPNGRGGYIANHPTELSRFMAEWGLDVHLRDLKAVVDQARQISGGPRPKVVLGGHDFGANLAALFAAYNFNGVAGYSLIDGLLLLDGTPSPNAPPPSPQVPSDESYLNTGINLSGLLVSGLNRLRNPQGPSDAPFLLGDTFGPSSFQLVEVYAQLALFAPDEGSPLPQSLGPPVPATNAAALAMNVDDEFAPQSLTRFSMGFLRIPPGKSIADVATSGPDPDHVNPNGIYTPRNLGTDAAGNPMLQQWAGLTDLSTIGLRGKEYSDLATVAQGILYGNGDGSTLPGEANFVEWFFPERLLLDMLLAWNLDTANLSPRVVAALTARGGNSITVTENKRMNIPVLGVSAEQGIFDTRPYPAVFAFFPYQRSIPSAKFCGPSPLKDYAHNDVVWSANPQVADLIMQFINGGCPR
jgi:pimeloyl-ACP methyl ester carboxylesterase